jgi:hypothetical protein
MSSFFPLFEATKFISHRILTVFLADLRIPRLPRLSDVDAYRFKSANVFIGVLNVLPESRSSSGTGY